MVPDLPETLPVFNRLRNCRADGPSAQPARAEDSDAEHDWVEEPGKHRIAKICEAFREAGGRDWVSQLIHHWQLDNWPLIELASMLGISVPQVSRLRNHSSTSIGVLALWATRRGKPLPILTHSRFSVVGLLEAIKTTEWLIETMKAQPNRTPLPTVNLSENELYLLATLLSSRLQDDWDHITDRYEPDLYDADKAPSLSAFLMRFSSHFLHVTKEDSSAQRRYPIYFPNSKGILTETSRWFLCRDIDCMWRTVHSAIRQTRTVTTAWDVVDGLTPWLGGAMSHDDD